MSGFVPIVAYRDFWDVPRIFAVAVEGGLLVFEAPFDDERDEYSDEYGVYFVADDDAISVDDWRALTADAESRGHVFVSQVEFDWTRRQSVSAELVARFAAPPS